MKLKEENKMNNSDSPLMANNDEMSIGSSPSTVIELINYEDELDNMIPFEHDLYLTNEAEIEIDIAETTRDVLERLFSFFYDINYNF